MKSKEACKEIRNKLQDTLLKGLGKEEDYGLFQPDKSDSSKGWWLRPNTYLKDCQLESRVCILSFSILFIYCNLDESNSFSYPISINLGFFRVPK